MADEVRSGARGLRYRRPGAELHGHGNARDAAATRSLRSRARSTDVQPWRVVQAAHMTRRLLAGTPVPEGWARSAAATQMRLAAGRVRNEDGLVRVRVGDF